MTTRTPAGPAPAGPHPTADAARQRPSGWARALWFVALSAVATLVSPRFLTVPGSVVPALSLAAGVNAAFVIGTRGRQRAAWLAGAAALSFGLRLVAGLDVATAAVIAAGLVVEAAVFAALLPDGLDEALQPGRRWLVPRLLAVAALAAAAGSVVFALSASALAPASSALDLRDGLVRIGAGLTGILVVCPLARLARCVRQTTPRQATTAAAGAAVVLAALHVGFTANEVTPMYPYLAVAVLLFAVARGGPRAAAWLPALWAPLAVWYTTQGHGPWAEHPTWALKPVMGVQLYNLTTIVSAWLVASLQAGREQARGELARANEELEARVGERTAELRASVDALHQEIGQRVRAEARYRAIFAESTSVMLLIDPAHGRIVDANEAAARYYGWSVAELRTMNIGDLNTSSDAEVHAEMERARQLHRNHFDFRHRRADGEVRDVEVFSGPVGLDGETLLYSIVHDVTDAKRDERALRESEQRFRAAFDDAPVGMVELGLEPDDLGRYRHVNQTFCDIVGYRPDELQTWSVQDITHADDWPETADVMARLAAGSANLMIFEKRYRRGDGRVVWARLHISPMVDAAGRRYAIEHVEDVTDRRQAQELMDLIFDVSLDPMCVATIETGWFVRVNPAWERLLGWSAEELLARPFTDFVHPDDRVTTAEVMAGLRRGENILGFENRYRCRDGTYRWLQWNSSALQDRDLVVANARDVTERKRAEADLVHRALYDPLTSLANRQLLHDRLRQALNHLDRQAGSVAVCYLDLDRFKDVNDTLGHETGDHVLVEVARRLTGNVRSVDTVARLAGDEFVVICPDLDEEHAGRLADRLLAALDEPIEHAGHRFEVGASIGIAVNRARGVSDTDLLHRADTAMYHAKHHGRHRWTLYTEALHDRSREREALHQDLRDALLDDRLRLFYQPIVDLASGRIVGAEALVRLDHPTRGLLLPAEFIEVAEESDLVVPLGDWVLGHACRQGAEWNDRFSPFDLAVNVSGRHLARGTVADRVLAALARSGLAPARLSLDVTQDVLVDAGPSVIEDLRRLTDHGVHLAVDNFGTGYSSLTGLEQFPVDIVKIDRSFVAALGDTRHVTAIVQAVTTLARSLGFTTVAEGIEHPHQLRHLRSLACDRGQGYLFHRPQPAHHLSGLLEAQAALAPSASASASSPTGRPRRNRM